MLPKISSCAPKKQLKHIDQVVNLEGVWKIHLTYRTNMKSVRLVGTTATGSLAKIECKILLEKMKKDKLMLQRKKWKFINENLVINEKHLF